VTAFPPATLGSEDLETQPETDGMELIPQAVGVSGRLRIYLLGNVGLLRLWRIIVEYD
jgi:hypothetical protein